MKERNKIVSGEKKTLKNKKWMNDWFMKWTIDMCFKNRHPTQKEKEKEWERVRGEEIYLNYEIHITE